MKIILDSCIIISDPTVLSKKKPSISLVIPFSNLPELKYSTMLRGVQSLSAVVNSAIKENLVQVYKPATTPSSDTLGLPSYGLSPGDLASITAAQELLEQGENVILATQDRVLSQYAAAIGIKTIDLKILQDILSEDIELNKKINRAAKALLSAQTRHFVLGIVVGILGNVLVSLIWVHFERIVATATAWGTIIAIVIAGLLIYSLRARFRLQYGVFEFIFGIFIATKIFWPDFDYTSLKPLDLLQLLAGIYVMVRGQDNIGKALRGTRFAFYWGRFSGES